MIYIVVSNIIALIAAILMVYSGTLKNKQKILYVQSIHIGLQSISNLLVKGISGFIINVINLIRNIICYKNKLRLKEKIVISVIASILIICFNNLGIIGLLPLIATIIYIWYMDIKDVKKFKVLIIVTMIMWFVYDLIVKIYTSALFDLLTIITNIITISKIKKKTGGKHA